MSLATRFDALPVKAKARWIAAVCAFAGVVMGFCLYVVVSHTAEQPGGVPAKLGGIAAGLAVAIGIAKLGEWLWETISTGSARIGHSKRGFVSVAVFLVIIFELCATTFEDFARATFGDFGSVQYIASRIAGTNESGALITRDNADLPGLLERMRASVRSDGMPEYGSSEPATPTARLVETMDPADQLILFVDAFDPKPSFVDAASMSFSANSSVFDTTYGGVGGMGSACNLRAFISTSIDWDGSGSAAAAMVKSKPLPKEEVERRTALQAEQCLGEIRAVAGDVRINRLREALNSALDRRDLFDDASFKPLLPPEGSPERKPIEDLFAELNAQRALCEAIVAEAPDDAKAGPGSQPSCVRVLNARDDLAQKYTGLAPRSRIEAMNRALLAFAYPGLIEPLPVYWWDFVMLLAVWCIAGIALALLLNEAVFLIRERKPILRALVPSYRQAAWALAAAAGAMGVTVILFRMVRFVFDLMFGPPPSPEMGGGFVGTVLNLVPFAVGWIASLDIWGWHIPGWISFPVIVIVLAVIASSRFAKGGLAIFAGWALAGVFLLSFLSVLPGILGLMLVVAVTWLVPAAGLATLLPYLEPGSKVPRWWGLIALVVAVILGVWALVGLGRFDTVTEAVLGATSLALFITGVLVFREYPVRELWPILAVTVAFCLLGATSLWQDATFKGVLNGLHPITESAPLPDAKPVPEWSIFLLGRRVAEPDVPEAARQGADDSDLREATRLELALVGSLGFWLTISLLAAWSLRRAEEGETAPAGAPTRPAEVSSSG